MGGSVCSNQTADTIARLLVEEIICRHGAPNRLLSDRGSNLLAEVMQRACKLCGIKKINTTAYHPQTDGMVERFNRSLRAMLAKYGKKYGAEWDRNLPFLLFAYRTKVHESTKESPYFLLYGRSARLPTETVLTRPKHCYQVDVDDYVTDFVDAMSAAWQVAGNNIASAQEKQKQQHDKRTKERAFAVGDQVMVFMPQLTTEKNRKLALPHYGPYVITDVTATGVKVRPVNQT